MTRSTRRAANAAAAAVLAFFALWFLTTQVKAVRALSPFADDPWDAFATYAAIFLPFVAGPTWIRSLRHRSPLLPASTARRIRWGSGLAAAFVLVSAAADAEASVTLGFPTEAGLAAGLIGVLVASSIIVAIVAIALAIRAAAVARTAEPAWAPGEPEPDIVDDLLALATDIARPVGLRGVVDRLTGAIDGFLERSALSPRRHRVGFGLVLAVAIGVAFAVWHSIREGPPPSLAVPLIFATLTACGVLAAYLGTVGSLRLLRPPRS